MTGGFCNVGVEPCVVAKPPVVVVGALACRGGSGSAGGTLAGGGVNWGFGTIALIFGKTLKLTIMSKT